MPLQRYRFSFGNSNDGPIGGVIVVTTDKGQGEALGLANAVLFANEEIAVKVETPSWVTGVEYFNVYCNGQLTMADLEEVQPVEEADVPTLPTLEQLKAINAERRRERQMEGGA